LLSIHSASFSSPIQPDSGHGKTAISMSNIMDYPIAMLLVSLALQWAAALAGDLLRSRGRPLEGDERNDYSTILPAALTLLALIIGFSFSMAVSRYDQRKNYEEAEANAIGTEYVRADLLPTQAAARVRLLLIKYTDQRILFYRERDAGRLRQINSDTAKVQADLWSAIAPVAMANPTPVTAMVAAGMNDVLNSQGYTQAAWWNRIPAGAWELMVLVAMACNFLFGYAARRSHRAQLLVLPLLASASFFLIADIDSPRGGVIRVVPQNLIALSQSLTPP
jgi:hypothetical protein